MGGFREKASEVGRRGRVLFFPLPVGRNGGAKKKLRMDGSIERAQRQIVYAVVGVRAEKWKCTMARVELLTFGVATGGALCLESAMGRSLVVSVVGS